MKKITQKIKKFFERAKSFCIYYKSALKQSLSGVALCIALALTVHPLIGLAFVPVILHMCFSQQNMNILFDRTLELLELIAQQQKEINELTVIVKYTEQKEKGETEH